MITFSMFFSFQTEHGTHILPMTSHHVLPCKSHCFDRWVTFTLKKIILGLTNFPFQGDLCRINIFSISHVKMAWICYFPWLDADNQRSWLPESKSTPFLAPMVLQCTYRMIKGKLKKGCHWMWKFRWWKTDILEKSSEKVKLPTLIFSRKSKGVMPGNYLKYGELTWNDSMTPWQFLQKIAIQHPFWLIKQACMQVRGFWVPM